MVNIGYYNWNIWLSLFCFSLALVYLLYRQCTKRTEIQELGTRRYFKLSLSINYILIIIFLQIKYDLLTILLQLSKILRFVFWWIKTEPISFLKSCDAYSLTTCSFLWLFSSSYPLCLYSTTFSTCCWFELVCVWARSPIVCVSVRA